MDQDLSLNPANNQYIVSHQEEVEAMTTAGVTWCVACFELNTAPVPLQISIQVGKMGT